MINFGSRLLLVGLVLLASQPTWGGCPPGKVEVNLENPNGKERVICVSSKARGVIENNPLGATPTPTNTFTSTPTYTPTASPTNTPIPSPTSTPFNNCRVQDAQLICATHRDNSTCSSCCALDGACRTACEASQFGGCNDFELATSCLTLINAAGCQEECCPVCEDAFDWPSCGGPCPTGMFCTVDVGGTDACHCVPLQSVDAGP